MMLWTICGVVNQGWVNWQKNPDSEKRPAIIDGRRFIRFRFAGACVATGSICQSPGFYSLWRSKVGSKTRTPKAAPGLVMCSRLASYAGLAFPVPRRGLRGLPRSAAGVVLCTSFPGAPGRPGRRREH